MIFYNVQLSLIPNLTSATDLTFVDESRPQQVKHAMTSSSNLDMNITSDDHGSGDSTKVLIERFIL